MKDIVERRNHFFNVPQSEVINRLHTIDSRKKRCVEEREYSDGGTLFSENRDFSLDVDNILEFQWVPSTKQLFVAIREAYYTDHKETVYIRISSYARRCEKSSIKELRVQLNKDLASLRMIRLPIGGANNPVPLFVRAYLDQGYIVVQMSSYLVNELKKNRGVMQIPCIYFEISTKKYRYATDMLYYISLMRFLNYKQLNRRDHITVRSLLEVTALPSLEEARNSANGSIRERIYKPFFSNLHALDMELEYELIDSAGFPISEEEAMKLDFYDFQRICVHFRWVHESELWTSPVLAQ